MDNNESSGFKMSIDDKSPDSELQEEIDDLRISKLSQRITLVTILIPTLIGILLLVAYLDMKKKVDKTFNAEAKQVQNLSQNLESKFSSLSLQFAKLEDTFAKKILSLEKETDGLDDLVPMEMDPLVRSSMTGGKIVYTRDEARYYDGAGNLLGKGSTPKALR